ncbi:aldose epimerase family protein [Caldimonas tepidiphila]|uniref:aldose epimerase family protein n=1 Tax=Caldimonas tepidiphila TaxID=2315841 RepID=UPI000E5A2D8E|nr:aldose epimerase family protein [Caldimonas tepidiphila]
MNDRKTITVAPWGRGPGGRPARLYTLDDGAGVRAQLTDHGATVVSLRAPDREGRAADVVLGFDALDGYLQPGQPYLGAMVGRHANRIAAGRFTLDGRQHRLACNSGGQHLHGGRRGFDRVVWQSEVREGEGGAQLLLRHVSADGDEGYPGRLEVELPCTLAAGALRLECSARCDAPTIVNLTSHMYFNLAGQGDVLGHELQILAARFTPVDASLIPTGELREVQGSPMDFRRPRRVGERLDLADEQLRHAGGYDHNWVLDGPAGTLRPVARLREPASGRTMEVLTTQPGLQFYSGNFLDGRLAGRGGVRYARHAGLCLETQHFPDSPNHPHFPSTRLAPGEEYRQVTVYRFGTDAAAGG